MESEQAKMGLVLVVNDEKLILVQHALQPLLLKLPACHLSHPSHTAKYFIFATVAQIHAPLKEYRNLGPEPAILVRLSSTLQMNSEVVL
jgi:hypothetical protein